MKRDLSRTINKKTLQTLMVTAALIMSTFAILSMQIQPAHAATTSIDIIPQTQEFGPENATGQEFIIKAYVTNVTDLYGIDLQFKWNPTYLLYLNHTVKIPVTIHPDGILYPGILVMDSVNTVAGTYSLAYACMAPAYSFNGTGIAFEMAFRIIDHPVYPEPDAVLSLHWTSSQLSDSNGTPLPGGWTENDGTVTIHAISYDYPPKPMLKIMPETVNAPTGTQFNSSVLIMGEDGGNLDPFWDVAGFDVYMNFRRTETPYVIIEALDVTIDPDGTFAAFWPNGIFEIDTTINNTEGWVHVMFLGMPGTNGNHTAPSGTFCIFKVKFNATYADTPALTTNITLKNPSSLVHRMNLHADDGLINLTSPLDTEWHAINAYDYGALKNLYAWTDMDGDGQLSSGDEIMLNDTSSGVWHHYAMNEVKGTLGPMEQQPFPATDDYLCMDCPTHKYSPWPKIIDTGMYFNGWGLPYFTGNFSCTYPVDSVNSFTVIPQIGANYTLTEGVDFVVNPDGTIDLLTALDERVENEYVGTMPAIDAGWPAIAYIASGFESVWIEMLNGTQRYARNNGYMLPPPSEYWFDPDFPFEIESYWATGYYSGSWTWPDGTDIYINYSAPAFVHIDYNAFPDSRPYYVEFNSTYTEFLAALADPVGTGWDEIYPSTMPDYDFMNWTDSDLSGNVTIGDYIILEGTIGNRTFLVNGIATDIIVDQILTVDDVDQRSPFYGEEIIAGVAGFPHPDRALSPWHNSSSSMPLPHDVENASAVIPEFPASFTLVLSLMAATIIAVLMKPKPKKTEK